MQTTPTRASHTPEALYHPFVVMTRITNPYMVTAIACIGGLLFGFNISSMPAVILSPKYLTHFGLTEQRAM